MTNPLDTDVINYRRRILKQMKHKINHRKLKNRIAIIAGNASCTIKGQGVSGGSYDKLYDKTPTLKEKLLIIAKPPKKIGGKSELCNIPIGNCAEDKAARMVIIKSHNAILVDNIYFSKAVRIRTCEIIPPCENCKAVFQTLTCYGKI